MRTLKLVLFSLICTSFFYACSESNDIWSSDIETDLGRDKSEEGVVVTVPFKVSYIGEYQPFGDRCEGAFNVIVDGVGQGTHVGHSTIHFDFCGLPQPDGSFIYGDPYPSDANIIAANGDELYLSVSGTVIPGRTEDHPDYVISYWRDPFVILGGTGKFEGATGGGWTDDYNSSEDPNSHHYWEGTINLIKGKR